MRAPRERAPWPQRLTDKRRRIEKSIGQLTERYHAKRVRARGTWHLLGRWRRKVLSHILALLRCQWQHLPPLPFADLVSEPD
jgi:hypothetical protein